MTVSGEHGLLKLWPFGRSRHFRSWKRIGVKPRLLIEVDSPERTVAALRDILAATNMMFERGVPVRLPSIS